MTHGADKIEVLKGLDAIKRRPGMYLGDTRRLGAARLIKCGVDVLAALTVCRDPHVHYGYHAFLDVTLSGRLVTVLIDHHPDECPDIEDRCHSLAKNREDMRPDVFALDQKVNSLSSISVLSALSIGLHIARAPGGPIINSELASVPDLPQPMKGAHVYATFKIGDQIGTDGLTADYLTGFIEGARHVQALVPRNILVA